MPWQIPVVSCEGSGADAAACTHLYCLPVDEARPCHNGLRLVAPMLGIAAAQRATQHSWPVALTAEQRQPRPNPHKPAHACPAPPPPTPPPAHTLSYTPGKLVKARRHSCPLPCPPLGPAMCSAPAPAPAWHACTPMRASTPNACTGVTLLRALHGPSLPHSLLCWAPCSPGDGS